jgi:hypothetical protein
LRERHGRKKKGERQEEETFHGLRGAFSMSFEDVSKELAADDG